VISPTQISGSGYTPTRAPRSGSRPRAPPSSSGSSPNTGGDFLPGNGNSGSNEGIYIYTLAFTITGTGAAGTVVNSANSQIQITMTLAADDQYSVYVNPSETGSDPHRHAAATQTNAWNNTTEIALQNYGSGGADNSTFKIGTNYIVVVVDNTNSQTGSSTSRRSTRAACWSTRPRRRDQRPPGSRGGDLAPLVGVIGCYGLIVLGGARDQRLQPVGA
jgi:hypothetical protein